MNTVWASIMIGPMIMEKLQSSAQPTIMRRAPPYCLAYIKVSGTQYLPTLNKGKNVFNCFQSINPKKDPVFPLPAGTPSPA